MFLGSATFAEETFADLLELITPPPISTIVGGFSKKKKYKDYIIFGKTYQLTEKEYQLYLAQRQAFENSIKNKSDEELYDIVEDSIEKKTKNTVLADLIKQPIFTINKLDIPLSNIKFDKRFESIALQKLVTIRAEQQRKHNAALDKDDEDLAMIMMFMY